MKRKYIPLKIQLAAALIQLGLDPKTAELDHVPALSRRDRRGQIFTPDELDPNFLQWMAPEPHAVKTFGPGGEKRITTRGGDIGEATHERHVTATHAEFRKTLLRKRPGRGRKPGKGKFPSRKFPKRRKANADGRR